MDNKEFKETFNRVHLLRNQMDAIWLEISNGKLNKGLDAVNKSDLIVDYLLALIIKLDQRIKTLETFKYNEH